MGVVLGSAVVPIAMCITWKKANKWGCISGAIAGFCVGVIAWLVTTSALNEGSLTVTVCPCPSYLLTEMLMKSPDHRWRP